MTDLVREIQIFAPLCVVFLLLAFWIALLAIPGAWLLTAIFIAPMSMTALLIGAAVSALALVTLFWRRHWVSGVTMGLGLVTLVLLTTQPNIGNSPARWVANLTQVAYYRGALLRQARELSQEGVSPALAAIGIDGFGSLTSGVALDPTGEILLPPDKRSDAWKAAANHSELGVDDLQGVHVIGDYYSWFHD